MWRNRRLRLRGGAHAELPQTCSRRLGCSSREGQAHHLERQAEAERQLTSIADCDKLGQAVEATFNHARSETREVRHDDREATNSWSGNAQWPLLQRANVSSHSAAHRYVLYFGP